MKLAVIAWTVLAFGTARSAPVADGQEPPVTQEQQINEAITKRGWRKKPTTSTTSSSSSSTVRARSSSTSSSAPAASSTAPTTNTGSTANNGNSLWQPAVGEPFQIVLSGMPDTSVAVQPAAPVNIIDIDMFGATPAMVSALKSQGKKVICYISAGSSEDWRPDYSQFKSTDKGLALSGWAGEKWLDIRSANVRSIMAKRMQMAKDKGCDAIDPDNVDSWTHVTGFPLTKADAIDYMNFLADTAASLGLSIGLKNAQDLLPHVSSKMQFAINESCAKWSECALYDEFLKTKPVFHIEYVDARFSKRGVQKFGMEKRTPEPATAAQLNPHCDPPSSPGTGSKMSTVIKMYNLDGWTMYCDGTSVITKTI